MSPYHKTAMLYARAQELFHAGDREGAREVSRKADAIAKRIGEQQTAVPIPRPMSGEVAIETW